MRTDRALRRDGRTLALDVCTGPLERACGLLRRPPPAPGVALWIAPCNAVHTWGMRYPIDVAFVDDRGLVVRVVPQCAPGCVTADSRAHSALEFRAGECARLGLRAGERLVMPSPPRRAPASTDPVTRERALRLLAVAAVVATLWMLGGCATRRPPASVPGSATVPEYVTPRAAGTSVDDLALQAAIEYESRAWPAAEAAYRALVGRVPHAAESWYRLGVVQLRLGRPDDAATALQRAASLGSRSGAGAAEQALAIARLAQAAATLRLAATKAAADAVATGVTPDSRGTKSSAGTDRTRTAATRAGLATREELTAAAELVERLLPPDVLEATP